MIKSIKIMLLPNNKQRTKMYQMSGVARFAYNWALGRQKENYENGGKFIQDNILRKEFTQLKKTDKYLWLNQYSNTVTKQAIKDSCEAYIKFFKKQSKFPKFKSKRKSRPSFYVDNVKIEFSDTYVKLEKIANSTRKNRSKANWIKLAEKGRVPTNCKYYNPRVTYDGINWWISVGIEVENIVEPVLNSNDGIGIDIGIKDLAICSDGYVYKNINKTQTIKKLKKKKRRLQRKISRKYYKNKKGNSYCKTKNIIKCEKELLKLNHRMTNIRHNYLHQVIADIIKRKPSFIVLENLNVQGMMKNRHLAKAIQEQCFYEFYRIMQYKSVWNYIKFIEAERYYASSKMCNRCKNIKKNLKLSDRIYICDHCGLVIDRDDNASINLANYGKLAV